MWIFELSLQFLNLSFFHYPSFSGVKKYNFYSEISPLELVVPWSPHWGITKMSIIVKTTLMLQLTFFRKTQVSILHLGLNREPSTCTRALHWKICGFQNFNHNSDIWKI